MTEDVRISTAKKATYEMFSSDVGYHRASKVIQHFLTSLPREESPYEQAILYRKLVGME